MELIHVVFILFFGFLDPHRERERERERSYGILVHAFVRLPDYTPVASLDRNLLIVFFSELLQQSHNNRNLDIKKSVRSMLLFFLNG